MPSLVSVKKWSGPRKCCFFCLVSFGSATFWLSDCTAVPQTTGTGRKMYLLRVRRWWSIPGWANRPSPGAWGVPRAWLQWFYPFTEPRRVLFHFTLLLQHRQCGACGFFFFLCHFNAATIQRPQDPLTQAWARTLSSFPRFISVRLSFPYILTHSTSSSSSISIFLTFLLFLLSLCFKTSPRLWLSRSIKYQSLAANIKLKSINE